MREYNVFAPYYDVLTQNVEYQKRCDYLEALMRRCGCEKPELMLDLACGTGSMTLELAKRGYDVIGVDASENMLSVAQQKALEAGQNILFLRQKMQRLDLYGTIDVAICTLDSINHLLSPEDVRKTFRKVSLFMNPGGFFFFDVNTEYKHETVLGDNTFVYETDEVFCVWQNSYRSEEKITHIQLDFFEKQDELYQRRTETFSERAYSQSELCEWLQEAGFEVLEILQEQAFTPPTKVAQRVVFAARKVR